jgi:hypothetical protein
MANFNLEDYEPVQNRIAKVLNEQKGVRIITHMLSPVDALDEVIFKAELYLKHEDDDEESLVATGWAHEIKGAGFVNKTSHIENCETSAIGRALANYGYHGDKRPSREEMEKAARTEIAQSSSGRKEREDGKDAITQGFPDNPITAAQMKELLKLVARLKNVNAFQEYLEKTFRVVEYKDISQKDYPTITKMINAKLTAQA